MIAWVDSELVFHSQTVLSILSSLVARKPPSQLKHASATPISLGSRLGFDRDTGGEIGCCVRTYDLVRELDRVSCHMGALTSGARRCWCIVVVCSMTARGVNVRVFSKVTVPLYADKASIWESGDHVNDLVPRAESRVSLVVGKERK